MCADGKVYTAGDNSRGQLGRNIATGTATATNFGPISSIDNAVQASIGCSNSVAAKYDASSAQSVYTGNLAILCSDGKVYTAGENSLGQLGRNVASGSATATNLGAIPDIDDAVQISISCGVGNMYSSDGRFYTSFSGKPPFRAKKINGTKRKAIRKDFSCSI